MLFFAHPIIVLLLLLKKIGNARQGEGDWHRISLKTPAPHYQPLSVIGQRSARNGPNGLSYDYYYYYYRGKEEKLKIVEDKKGESN